MYLHLLDNYSKINYKIYILGYKTQFVGTISTIFKKHVKNIQNLFFRSNKNLSKMYDKILTEEKRLFVEKKL